MKRRDRRRQGEGSLLIKGRAARARHLIAVFVFAAVIFTHAAAAQSLLVVNHADGTIDKYSLQGATIHRPFLSGLYQPFGIAVDGGFLYVVEGNGLVKKFTIGGALVNGALIRGLYGPIGVAVSDGFVYVANGGGESSTVGKYTTDGTAVNTALVTGLGNPSGVAIDGDYLYVAEWHTGRVGKYRTDGGTAGNASLVTGLTYPGAVVTDGTGLVYVSDFSRGVTKYRTNGMRLGTIVPPGYNSGLGLAVDRLGYIYYANNFGGDGGNRIGKYTSAGILVNASLIAGLRNPVALAIVPEQDVPTNHPPVGNAGSDQMLECSGDATVVTLDASASSDPDGDPLTYNWWEGATLLGTQKVLNVTFGTGTHAVRLRVTDPLGESAEDFVQVSVEDTTAPRFSRLDAVPAILWPPNHKMIPVRISAEVTDTCEPSANARIVFLESNEPAGSREDWEITGPLTVNLRAERTGTGKGRLYRVHIEAVDSAGNKSTNSVSVTVPQIIRQIETETQLKRRNIVVRGL